MCVCVSGVSPSPPLSLVHLLCAQGAETGCSKAGREAPPDSPFHTTPPRSGCYPVINVSWPSGACAQAFFPLCQALGCFSVTRSTVSPEVVTPALPFERGRVTNDPHRRNSHFPRTGFSGVPLSCNTR